MLLASRLSTPTAIEHAVSSNLWNSSAVRVVSTLPSLGAAFFNGERQGVIPSHHTIAEVDALARQREGRRSFFRLPGDDSGLSKKYTERRLLGWTQQQLYDVVADVNQYEQFVPWCQRSQVTLTRGNYMEAELEVGFKVFVERYTSRITLSPGHSVHSEVGNSTLFEHLNSTWQFTQGPTAGSCWLAFSVDFEFRSPLYRQVATIFFEEVVQRMMGAFQERCQQVYGPPSLGRAGVSCSAKQPEGAAAAAATAGTTDSSNCSNGSSSTGNSGQPPDRAVNA